MKLWLNEETGVLKSDVVGIFDLDSATVGQATKKTLKRHETEGNLTVTTGDIPVSFVVVARDSKTEIFLTRNAPRALRRRAERRGI